MQTKKIKHSREYLLRCFDFDFETGNIYFKSRNDIQNFNSHCGFNQWKNKVGKKLSIHHIKMTIYVVNLKT